MFANERKHSILLPKDVETGKPPTIAYLVNYLCEKTMQDDRREMFVFEGSVYDYLRSGKSSVLTETGGQAFLS